MPRTFGSLFSGIGGIDLGLERAGWRCLWQSEIDPYASKVLAKHWPDVRNLGDITEIDWSDVERPDLLCGGFPCQPVSVAGKRRGQDDERWLWPEYARAIRHLRPGHVLVENVPGLLVRGMGDVLGDLADLGYDCEWESLPAAAVGAPHLRYRVLVVAHARGRRGQTDQLRPGRNESRPRSEELADPAGVLDEEVPQGADGAAMVGAGARTGRGTGRGAAATGVPRLGGGTGRVAVADPEGISVRAGLCEGDTAGVWGRRPSDLCGPHRGWWAAEPELGRVAHGIPARVDRLRCLGNAVVPQVAELVGRRLMTHIDGTVSE